MSYPLVPNWNAIKKIMRYLRGVKSVGDHAQLGDKTISDNAQVGDGQYVSYTTPDDYTKMHTCATHTTPKDDTRTHAYATHDDTRICPDAAHLTPKMATNMHACARHTMHTTHISSANNKYSYADIVKNIYMFIIATMVNNIVDPFKRLL